MRNSLRKWRVAKEIYFLFLMQRAIYALCSVIFTKDGRITIPPFIGGPFLGSDLIMADHELLKFMIIDVIILYSQ